MAEELVIFKLGEEEYGAVIDQVKEIRQMTDVTPVPKSPKFVTGVVNLRGKVIPMVDLRVVLGLAPKKPDRATRIIVVDMGESTIGAVVDSVLEVLTLEDIERSHPMVDQPWVKGVGKIGERLMVILDFEALFKGVVINEQDKGTSSG